MLEKYEAAGAGNDYLRPKRALIPLPIITSQMPHPNPNSIHPRTGFDGIDWHPTATKPKPNKATPTISRKAPTARNGDIRKENSLRGHIGCLSS